MRSSTTIPGVLALALLTACASSKDMSAPASAPSPAAAAPPPPPPSPAFGGGREERDSTGDRRLAMADTGGLPTGAAPGPPSSPSSRNAGEAVAVRAPLLIYTAQITMAVFEVNASLTRVETIGRELGGFLAKRDDQSITIRVPAAAFQEAVKRVEGVGDMLHRNVTAEDVTEEFRDLEIRLKSARAVQARLTELLAKAVKVEESIAIERELDRVSGEIERIEGRAKFLRDRAAFSTLTVRFEAKATEQVGNASVRLPVGWLNEINLPRLLRL
jgi:hypothetical protein